MARGKQCGEPPRREHVETSMGVSERRTFRRHDERRAQRDLESTGHTRAVDRADRRRAHRAQGPAGIHGEASLARVEVGLHVLEVDTGAEGRIGAGDHHHADRGVAVGDIEQIAELERAWRGVNAFFTWGRSKVIVRTPCSSSTIRCVTNCCPAAGAVALSQVSMRCSGTRR